MSKPKEEKTMAFMGIPCVLILALAGIAGLVVLLWRLWTREQEQPQRGVAAPEIEIDVTKPVPPAEPSPAEVEATEEPEEPPAVDDLKRIEGIGPKISGVLQEAGITTFAALADTEVSRIEEILEQSSPRLRRLAKPETWPEQAALAAAGEWDALKALQGELKGGRRS